MKRKKMINFTIYFVKKLVPVHDIWCIFLEYQFESKNFSMSCRIYNF